MRSWAKELGNFFNREFSHQAKIVSVDWGKENLGQEIGRYIY